MARIPAAAAAAFTRSYISRMYVLYLFTFCISIYLYTSPALRRIIQYLRVLDAPVADARHYRNAYCISLTTHTKGLHSCCIDTPALSGIGIITKLERLCTTTDHTTPLRLLHRRCSGKPKKKENGIQLGMEIVHVDDSIHTHSSALPYIVTVWLYTTS